MNKKFIGIGVLGLVVLTLGLAGFAYAQGQPPQGRDYPFGYDDMMDGYGGHSDGMMGNGYGMMGWNGEEGPMHEVMINTIAQSLNLTPQKIEARHDAGESIWKIARAEGLSDEEIQELMFSG